MTAPTAIKNRADKYAAMGRARGLKVTVTEMSTGSVSVVVYDADGSGFLQMVVTAGTGARTRCYVQRYYGWGDPKRVEVRRVGLYMEMMMPR